MTEPAPTTGDPTIDQACAQVADLSEVPLGEHLDRLAQAHEQIAERLRGSAQRSQTDPR
ncbi:MAG: hypothetical protein Q4G45_13945 [Actinomycetia bacterium]|nr:hypothetical protein [Actinomycetes bacterium]